MTPYTSSQPHITMLYDRCEWSFVSAKPTTACVLLHCTNLHFNSVHAEQFIFFRRLFRSTLKSPRGNSCYSERTRKDMRFGRD